MKISYNEDMNLRETEGSTNEVAEIDSPDEINSLDDNSKQDLLELNEDINDLDETENLHES